MTVPVLPAGALAPSNVASTTPAGPTPPSDLHRVAAEFEAMLLRQLLGAAKMGSGAAGYGDMAVDALANGINQAGGVGLARQIETVLQNQIGAHEPVASLSHSSFDASGRSSR